MKMPSRLAILFNGAALLIALGSGAAILRSVFAPDEIAPCSTRYGQGIQLSLERGRGELLTAADLQARFGGADWGLLDNARVVEIKGDAVRPAIEVRLAKVTAEAPTGETRSGMGFAWAPRTMRPTSAACLSYSLLMPADFDYAKGGRLPGLLTSSSAPGASPPVTIVRSGWREAGVLEVRTQFAGASEARSLSSDRNDYVIPRGQWVGLEQEVVLNTPGQKDGAVRVWADGVLRFEKTGLILRDGEGVSINGAAAEAFSYGASPSRDRKLWFSALELRWQ